MFVLEPQCVLCVCVYIVNPRRVCARVTVVVFGVCVCVHGPSFLPVQLHKRDILMDSVSWLLQN